MKNLIILLSLCFSIQCVYSQNGDPRLDQFNFVPGEIIVKLKDNVDTGVTYNSRGIGSTQTDIGKLLGIQDKVSKTNVLFSEKSVQNSVARKNSNFRDSRLPNPHTLKNTFLLKLNNNEENILSLVEELNNNDSVEYAEPNYNYSVNDFTIESDIITSETINKNYANSLFVVTPDDPLYGQQVNIPAVNIDQVWDTYTTGDGSQIIAILDTGVDYTHPDLEANIWINAAELNGVEGFDDDGNGFIDDIRGWDFINLDNAPLDDNMHGTHVAGIAGAVGNNGIGIAGAVWNVKLMPIKVFQSNGVGNVSTIALGIEYAANNGATILNMSFGSYAESSTLRNALENAYATSVLVAAAGNDGAPIGLAPFYPAAYTYVIGVQDDAGYSNSDPNPIFSSYSNYLNYELKAPGTGIISTVPNGGYRNLTGTSMSSPLVAGGIALYLQEKPEDSKELLFGNLINTSAAYIDLLAALEAVPTPELQILSAIVKDTINGQNGNEFIEPNETIEIFPLIKNYWGPTDDVRVGIEFTEFEDQTKAIILEDENTIGSISEYATLQSLTQSLKIQIAGGVANNVNIKFNLKVWSGDNQDYLTSTDFIINVKNSILLYGVKSDIVVLSPDKEYLVSANLALVNDAEYTIMPGTIIKISDGVKILIKDNAKLTATGTKDSRIIFQAEDNNWFGIKSISTNSVTFDYTEFRNGYQNSVAIFEGNNTPTISNSLFFDCFSFDGLSIGFNISDSKIIENNFMNHIVNLNNNKITNTIIANNKTSGLYGGVSVSYNSDFTESNNLNILNNEFNMNASGRASTINITSNIYFGSSREDIIRNKLIDFLSNTMSRGILNTDNVSSSAIASTKGIVWKVLVNGKDAQDEYELMDPVGVGTHTFDVYFNRTMDTNFPPQISYGVREPYNQKIITEAGVWSDFDKIYTITHEVKIGAADGINRIRVQGARDLDYFDIPIEDSRFNMLVQSAGSASTGFAATPGLGEITLDWVAPQVSELEDVLGYNMYRYEAITDTTFTDTVKINDALIADPVFVDFDVVEENQYFYQYKILRTSFEETDYSQTVVAMPLTPLLGDSNGDFSVNVMDVVQDVDYILGYNPTPFIFSAADVNNDTYINVLDIVGTVDIILNPSSGRIASRGSQSITYIDNMPIGDAIFYWEENDLYVESKEAITGMQLAFEKDFSYTISETLSNFEWLNYEQDNLRITMMYSFGNISIPAGKTKLLTKPSENEVSFNIGKAVVATTKGLKLNAIFEDRTMIDIEAPVQTDSPDMIIMVPNPTSGLLNIIYYLPEQMDKVLISAYTLQGARVWSSDAYKNTPGRTIATVNLSSLNNGIYLVVVDILRNGELKKREVKKIIINR